MVPQMSLQLFPSIFGQLMGKHIQNLNGRSLFIDREDAAPRVIAAGIVRNREEFTIRLPEQDNMPIIVEQFASSLEQPVFKKNRVVRLCTTVNANNCVAPIW